MAGPSGRRPSPLNGDQAVPGLRLRLGEPTWHDSFLFHFVPGHAPEGTSPIGLGMGIMWPSSLAFVLGLKAGASCEGGPYAQCSILISSCI
jgi:hypothetical protein